MIISGCVVLYNPGNDVWENLCAYMPGLERLYVIDNSEKYNSMLIAKIKKEPKCCYYSMKGNKGIAAALNKGIELGYRDGAVWMLTMDQDSYFPMENFQVLKDYAMTLQNERVAIVCGRYRMAIDKKPCKKGCVIRVIETITSGSMLRTDVWKKLGGYQEELFIDDVDHEYCLRLYSTGYLVERVNDAVFEHKLGNAKKKRGHIYYDYPPIRYYYIVRNRLYVTRKYENVQGLKEFCKEKRKLLKTKWLDDAAHGQRRIRNFWHMFLGYLHYRQGKLGKFGNVKKHYQIENIHDQGLRKSAIR